MCDPYHCLEMTEPLAVSVITCGLINVWANALETDSSADYFCDIIFDRHSLFFCDLTGLASYLTVCTKISQVDTQKI